MRAAMASQRNGHRQRCVAAHWVLWTPRDRSVSAPGRIRTCDTRFRKPVLYPLSYEGVRLKSPGRRAFPAVVG